MAIGNHRSFRDPAGFTFWTEGHLFRIVKQLGYDDYLAFENSSTAKRYRESGSIVSTRRLDPASVQNDGGVPISETYQEQGGELLLEHEPLPFPNFPYEWATEMLHRAASLTLALTLDLAAEGLGLKDATPYNVMFRGSAAVFLDVLSIERRRLGDPIWLPEAQFVRSFLLPLAVWRAFGVPPNQILLTHRDGLEPAEVYRWLPFWRKLSPSWLALASIPVWLGHLRRSNDSALYRSTLLSDNEQARFILTARLKSLQRRVASATPPDTSSMWADYAEGEKSYSRGQFSAKEDFVGGALREFCPPRVLDVGCNNGYFSFLAARNRAETVAIDLDPVVVGQVWRRAAAERLDVLPLVVNLARPTPAMGWNGCEHSSFLERARGRFDLVLMLAVLHHLMVTERIPVEEILDMIASLTTNLALVEYVDPQDPMFHKLARGRDHLYSGLTPEAFENICQRRFEILRIAPVYHSTRRMYVLRVKGYQ